MTEDTDSPISGLNYEITGAIKGVPTMKIGKRENGESSFHDTFTLTAKMPRADFHELLEAMGFSNTTFVDFLPEEAPEIALATTFAEQSVRITQGGKALFMVDGATLSDFKAKREDDQLNGISFKVKSLPTLKQHFNLEKVVLDSHTGQKFLFTFGTVDEVQGKLEMEEGQQPQPSNVTNIGKGKDAK